MSLVNRHAAPRAGDVTYTMEWPRASWSLEAPAAPGIAVAPRASVPVAAGARRESRATAPNASTLRFAGWTLDLIERRLVAPGGGTQRIPGLEFALLKAFLDFAREPLSRAELAHRLTRDGDVRLSGRTVDSYVSRLRRRLGRGGSPALIATVWSFGYRLDADVARS